VERKWKERYKQKFRRRAVARMNACENITRLSRELGVSRGLLYTWRYRLEPPDAQIEGTCRHRIPASPGFVERSIS
jgi:transposase-like protein